MKVSIVISVYNSHGVLDRQMKHFSKMGLPDDIEIIIADDESTPSLNIDDYQYENLSIYRTHNKLAWTQGLGRNLGASKAKGEYLLMTDIDHILTKELIDAVAGFKGVLMRFPRHLGILDEKGDLKTDVASLELYGAHPRYLGVDEPATGIHNNTFAIKKEVFDTIGGYKNEWCEYGYHPVTKIGDDVLFDSVLKRYLKAHGITQEMGPKVYVFPNGRFHKARNLNPFGLFHDLSQERQEKFYKP